MRGIEEIQADNERAASRELAELRADTVKGLRHAFATGGATAVTELLAEAHVIGPVFNQFHEGHDCLNPGEETVFPNGRE